MCIRYDALSFWGIREKRERERESDEEDNRGRSKKKKNPKNECDLKNRVYEKSGIFRGLILIPRSIDERQRDRERQREKSETEHKTHKIIFYSKRANSFFLTHSTRALER